MTILYSPAAIANQLLEKSGRARRALTPMQLLKLVYISHGWKLAVSGNPLFEEKVEAWPYGPVVPSLFHEFKRFRNQPISRLALQPDLTDADREFPELDLEFDNPFVNETDDQTEKIIDWVWKNYGRLSAFKLSQLTHRAGTPWSMTVETMKAENPGKDWVNGYPIDNELIRTHYVDLWTKRNAR